MIKTELIENYLKEKGLSKSAFCKQCKINYRTLKKVLSNENVNLVALFKIARILNIKTCELLVPIK